MLLTLTEEADPDFPFLRVHFSTEGGLGTGKGYVSMEVTETYEDMEGMPGSLRIGLQAWAFCSVSTGFILHEQISLNSTGDPSRSRLDDAVARKKFPALVLKHQLLSS